MDRIKMILAFCIVPFVAFAQQITTPSTTIDCGEVMYRNPITVSFEVKNTGNQPLQISKVLTDCGCIKVEYPRNSIATGKVGEIKATFDAKQMGSFVKHLDVVSNATQEPLMLTLTGKVVSEIKTFSENYPFSLGELLTDVNNIEFDNVNQGDVAQIKIHIKNTSTKVAQPNFMHLPVYLKADVYPERIAPGHAGVATITLDTRLLRDFGLTQTAIYLGFAPGDPISDDKEISVSTVLLPAFKQAPGAANGIVPKMKISTTTLDLGDFNGKKKLQGSIIIQNTGKAELDIENVQLFTQGIQLSLKTTKLAPGEQTKMKITAFANDIKRARSKPRILMITNDPELPKVVITINVK